MREHMGAFVYQFLSHCSCEMSRCLVAVLAITDLVAVQLFALLVRYVNGAEERLFQCKDQTNKKENGFDYLFSVSQLPGSDGRNV